MTLAKGVSLLRHRAQPRMVGGTGSGGTERHNQQISPLTTPELWMKMRLWCGWLIQSIRQGNLISKRSGK